MANKPETNSNLERDSGDKPDHEPFYGELLRLARETIAHYLSTGEILPYETENEWFLTPAAVFVTLRTRPYVEHADGVVDIWEPLGALRGCIGQIAAESPLYAAVQDAAIKAATEDPRFYPVTPDELDDIYIEISVLSPLRPVDSLDEIAIGRDGLLVSGERRRGLLLPEVPVTFGWTAAEFVRQVCHKAGLEASAWPRGARLYAFTTESFEEPASTVHLQ